MTRIGETLPNGATLLGHNETAHVVLGHNDGAITPYVTWRYSPEQGLSSTYCGHYFETLAEAVADFESRG